MNRLQKKCFLAATGFHLLLLVILFVGPAFLSPGEKFKNIRTIDVIPANIIEGALAQGGSPNAKPPPPAPLPPAPQPPAPQPQSQPPAPQPQPERIVKPEPVREIKPPKPDPDSLEIKTEKRPHKPEVNTTIVTRRPNSRTPAKTPPTSAPSTSDADAHKRETAERRQAFNNTLQSLREGLSSSTSVGIPGEGGEAYAGYDVVVQSIYQARYDQELVVAGGIAGNHAEVEVSVTIARNGDVISTSITNPSGNSALNKLVQRVLAKVTFVRPFPAASKDQQRTFTIVFELKPKKAVG